VAGQTVTADYPKGLNGLLLDIAGLPATSTLTEADYQFRTGNTSDPAT